MILDAMDFCFCVICIKVGQPDDGDDKMKKYRKQDIPREEFSSVAPLF